MEIYKGKTSSIMLRDGRFFKERYFSKDIKNKSSTKEIDDFFQDNYKKSPSYISKSRTSYGDFEVIELKLFDYVDFNNFNNYKINFDDSNIKELKVFYNYLLFGQHTCLVTELEKILMDTNIKVSQNWDYDYGYDELTKKSYCLVRLEK